MMVHPAAATTQHKVYKNWVEKAFNGLKKRIEAEHATKPASVVAIFQSEYEGLKKTYPELKPLEELAVALADEVIDDLNCVEVNFTPDAEKRINWKATKYWILVGGAKLDRGYTVEGLCVTYMPRPLGTSPAARTLQQRARFFGYKKAYLGLCRVFLQSSVRRAFTEYVEHEDFVRDALEKSHGKPLRKWRRDFILTQMLKPTIGLMSLAWGRAACSSRSGSSRVLQRDSAAVAANRALLDGVNEAWRDFLGPL